MHVLSIYMHMYIGYHKCAMCPTLTSSRLIHDMQELERRHKEFGVELEQHRVEFRQMIESAREELKEIRLQEDKNMKGRKTLLILSAGLTATFVVFPMVRTMVRGVSKIMY